MMTEGWKLNEGTVSYHPVAEDQAVVGFHEPLSQSMKTTSYKFAVLRGF